jgi:hypothetical protein
MDPLLLLLLEIRMEDWRLWCSLSAVWCLGGRCGGARWLLKGVISVTFSL